jgi:acyl-CoA thioesterase FadM
MARIKLQLPSTFTFIAELNIRISDINYGNHVGNDSILSLIHEARMQFLHALGYTELSCEGTALIMTDAVLEFKKELFYGDEIRAQIVVAEFTNNGFDVFYQLEKKQEHTWLIAVKAKTGMLCFDYTAKKIMAVPDRLKQILETGKRPH